ncbi:MAG: AmmeMemoRadiSam system radical SAM enzyme [Acidobacteria bacterium]|nr:AmmeMemoRadiSam system radical SAM enzyme [Acidobacteriota bacterium]
MPFVCFVFRWRSTLNPKTTPARFWHAEGDRVVCNLCPRTCSLHEGQRGFCYVRKMEAGKMVLTTYGRSSGFCIDPIEKKPLNHFLPGHAVLSFGTAGCNLGCKFCQNWDISKARDMDRLTSLALPEQIAASAQASGCAAVAFTYNDPVIFAEYAIDVAHACHDLGIKTVAVTAGYVTESARAEFFSAIDAANVDLKGFTESFYKKMAYGSLQPVLETLKFLRHDTDVWFEITNLVIPDANDDEAEIAAMCEWIGSELGADVPLHFTAFHPDYRLRDRPATPTRTLLRCRQQAMDVGLHHVYVGNVHHPSASSTYCHHCGHCLIERDWYVLGAYELDTEGRCNQCGTLCAGRFGSEKGTWGARRLPITIH